MTKLLTPEQVQRYERDGFVHPVPVLSRQEGVRLRGELGAGRLHARPARQPPLGCIRP